MKRTIILFLVFALVASFSCSKEEEKPRKDRTVKREIGKTSRIGYLIDPVSKNPVDVATSPYSYIYKEVEYNFESKENMETFIKNPEKYIAEIEEMQSK